MARPRAEIALPLTGSEPILDLNYLYQRYAVSLHMAENAACFPSRSAHLKLADGYAEQIAFARVQTAAEAAR